MTKETAIKKQAALTPYTDRVFNGTPAHLAHLFPETRKALELAHLEEKKYHRTPKTRQEILRELTFLHNRAEKTNDREEYNDLQEQIKTLEERLASRFGPAERPYIAIPEEFLSLVAENYEKEKTQAEEAGKADRKTLEKVPAVLSELLPVLERLEQLERVKGAASTIERALEPDNIFNLQTRRTAEEGLYHLAGEKVSELLHVLERLDQLNA